MFGPVLLVVQSDLNVEPISTFVGVIPAGAFDV